MKNNKKSASSLHILWLALLVTLSVSLVPTIANASGGSGGGGGGGSVKTYEARVTGYVTAIDYVNCTITIGASYYGSGSLKVTSSTSISMDTVSCGFDAIELGDWMEARYDWVSKTATKLSGTSVPTI